MPDSNSTLDIIEAFVRDMENASLDEFVSDEHKADISRAFRLLRSVADECSLGAEDDNDEVVPDMLWEHRYGGTTVRFGYSTDEERDEIQSSLTKDPGITIEWRQVPNPNLPAPTT
jgi:hypothetical protein